MPNLVNKQVFFQCFLSCQTLFQTSVKSDTFQLLSSTCVQFIVMGNFHFVRSTLGRCDDRLPRSGHMCDRILFALEFICSGAKGLSYMLCTESDVPKFGVSEAPSFVDSDEPGPI